MQFVGERISQVRGSNLVFYSVIDRTTSKEKERKKEKKAKQQQRRCWNFGFHQYSFEAKLKLLSFEPGWTSHYSISTARYMRNLS